jgi:uncharacterized protein (UPF0548 family)
VYAIGSSVEARFPGWLDEARRSDPTYAPVGVTLTGAPLPAGYRPDRHQILLSDRPEVFDTASEGLRTWQAHRGAGATVTPDSAPAEGETVLVSIRKGLIAVVAPCRIVGVWADANRYGFAYGTLPGHPEQGEEAFVVRRAPMGVIFEVVAFSRPADLPARLGGPLTRLVQRNATRGYLEGLHGWLTASL